MEKKTKTKNLELLTTFIVPQIIQIYKRYWEEEAIPIYWEGAKKNTKTPYIVVNQDNREVFKTKDDIYRLDYTLSFSIYASTQKEAIYHYNYFIDTFLEKDWVHSAEPLFDDKFLLYEFNFTEFGEYEFSQIEDKNLVRLDFRLIYRLIPNRENQD